MNIFLGNKGKMCQVYNHSNVANSLSHQPPLVNPPRLNHNIRGITLFSINQGIDFCSLEKNQISSLENNQILIK